MSEQQLPWEQPGWEGIHVTDEEITLDETGRVVINNPDLAKALKAWQDAQSAGEATSHVQRIGLPDIDWGCGFDWKCVEVNKKC